MDLPNFALKDDVELLKKLIAETPNITGISANSLYAIDLELYNDHLTRLLNGEVSLDLPVSVLNTHQDVTIYLDKETFGYLEK